MSSLESRIRALEEASGPAQINIIIRHFGLRDGVRAERISEAGTSIERLPDEDGDAFRARGLRTLRAGRGGLIVFTEHYER